MEKQKLFYIERISEIINEITYLSIDKYSSFICYELITDELNSKLFIIKNFFKIKEDYLYMLEEYEDLEHNKSSVYMINPENKLIKIPFMDFMFDKTIQIPKIIENPFEDMIKDMIEMKRKNMENKSSYFFLDIKIPEIDENISNHYQNKLKDSIDLILVSKRTDQNLMEKNYLKS